MRHWTHDGAYVAALLLLAASLVNLTLGAGWSAVAGLALGVLLLLTLRALEAYQSMAKALDVAADVEALTKDVMALRTAQAKTAEDASTALRGLATVRPVTRPQGY